jgi:hypothetical protein
LNQPQTISPPSSVRPYSEFQSKLQSFLSTVQSTASAAGAGALGSGATGSTGTSSTPSSPSGTTSTPSGSSPTSGAGSTVQSYSACLQAAGTDVTKMQRCASILNGK